MAWTTPRTWVATETVSAAQLNTHLRDNLIYLKDNSVGAASPTFTGTVSAPTVDITTDLKASGVPSTGTGAFVRKNAPTFVGTITAANITASGEVTAAAFVAAASVRAGNYLRAGAMAVPVSNVDYGVCLTNVAGAPPNTPSGGGFLYVHNGALKYTGPAGTTTTIAAA